MPKEHYNPRNSTEAVQNGWPELYLPEKVLENLSGQWEMVDDISLLKLGCRISPKGLRTMLLSAVNGFFVGDDFSLPFKSFQQRTSAILYGYFCGLFNQDEFNTLLNCKRITKNLAHSEGDLITSPFYQPLGNKILPTIEEVAVDIERRKIDNPKLKVLFLHGKWNDVPHPGHILVSREVCNTVNFDYGVDFKNMLVVVSCDTNSFIRGAGGQPFLNTVWRSSMMSYLPWVDYVCTSGDLSRRQYERGSVNHWAAKYRILKPDFVNVDPESQRSEEISHRIREIGAIPIYNLRIGTWRSQLGNPRGERLQHPFSATNVRNGETDMNTFRGEFQHLLGLKNIRDTMYKPGDLFQSPNIYRLDKRRGYFPVEIPVPDDPGELLRIVVPEKQQPYNEQLLQQALVNI